MIPVHFDREKSLELVAAIRAGEPVTIDNSANGVLTAASALYYLTITNIKGLVHDAVQMAGVRSFTMPEMTVPRLGAEMARAIEIGSRLIGYSLDPQTEAQISEHVDLLLAISLSCVPWLVKLDGVDAEWLQQQLGIGTADPDRPPGT